MNVLYFGFLSHVVMLKSLSFSHHCVPCVLDLIDFDATKLIVFSCCLSGIYLVVFHLNFAASALVGSRLVGSSAIKSESELLFWHGG